MPNGSAPSSKRTHPDKTALITAGLELMNLGYVVIPSGGPKGNNPSLLGPGWQNVHPSANEFVRAVEMSRATGIGAVTTRLAIVDCDTKHGIDGIGNFLKFVAEHDPGFNTAIDTAPAVETPTEGLHFHFSDPTGEVTNSGGLLAAVEGVDVRGQGGFIAMPPTQREGTNGYTWVQNPKPVSELTPAPDWLKGTVNNAGIAVVGGNGLWKPRDTERGITKVADHSYEVAIAPEGERNDTLHNASRAAGHLIAEGDLTPATAFKTLMAGAEACGLPAGEAEATIRSGIRYVIAKRASALTSVLDDLKRGR